MSTLSDIVTFSNETFLIDSTPSALRQKILIHHMQRFCCVNTPQLGIYGAIGQYLSFRLLAIQYPFIIFSYFLQSTTSEQIFRYPPCPQCGATSQKVGIGKGPHQASLRCGGCDRFIRWVGKAELAKLNKGGQD